MFMGHDVPDYFMVGSSDLSWTGPFKSFQPASSPNATLMVSWLLI